MCPMLINLTESSRIDSELRGWFHAPPSSKNPPTLNMHKPEVGHPLSKHELAKVSIEKDFHTLCVKLLARRNLNLKKE